MADLIEKGVVTTIEASPKDASEYLRNNLVKQDKDTPMLRKQDLDKLVEDFQLFKQLQNSNKEKMNFFPILHLEGMVIIV